MILTFVNSAIPNSDSERDDNEDLGESNEKVVCDEPLSDSILNIISGIQHIELFDVFFYPLLFYCLVYFVYSQ